MYLFINFIISSISEYSIFILEDDLSKYFGESVLNQTVNLLLTDIVHFWFDTTHLYLLLDQGRADVKLKQICFYDLIYQLSGSLNVLNFLGAMVLLEGYAITNYQIKIDFIIRVYIVIKCLVAQFENCLFDINCLLITVITHVLLNILGAFATRTDLHIHSYRIL